MFFGNQAALACCHAFLETSFFDDTVMSLLVKSTSGGEALSRIKRSACHDEIFPFVYGNRFSASRSASEVTAEVLNAAADLLKAGDGVESVDVVLSLHEMGAALSGSNDKEKFLAMTPDEALDWIRSSDSQVSAM